VDPFSIIATGVIGKAIWDVLSSFEKPKATKSADPNEVVRTTHYKYPRGHFLQSTTVTEYADGTKTEDSLNKFGHMYFGRRT